MVTISTSSGESLTRYFVVVSGENLALARAEIDALLRLLTDDFRVQWRGKFAEIDCAYDPTNHLINRAALVMECGIILAKQHSSYFMELDVSRDIFEEHVLGHRSFAVRTLCLDCEVDIPWRRRLEARLGDWVRKSTTLSVNLSAPDMTILVILGREQSYICISVRSLLRRELAARTPSRREFFHPSMMNVTLARIMCNLACVMPGDVVLDPFCGGGGILCEAALIGSRVLGSDLNWRLLTGAVTNIRGISQEYSMVQGNIFSLPFSKCDSLVTDPPDGRASSTRGAEARILVQALVDSIPQLVVRSGERVCICASSRMRVQQIVQDAGLRVGKHLSIRVHRGLVRDLVTVII